MKAELETLFGARLQYIVEEDVDAHTSNAVVITLGALLAISMLALILIVVLSIVK